MKRIVGIILSVLIIVSVTGCGNSSNKDENYLGGTGNFNSVVGMFGKGAIYDDENIYFDTYEYSYVVMPLNGEGAAYTACDDASCNHMKDDCKANSTNMYFEIDGKLYTAINYYNSESEANSYIKRCEDNKTVFECSIPNELVNEDSILYTACITRVTALSDTYIKIESGNFAYITDREFNEVLHHGPTGKISWGAIFDDKYYFINDLNKLMFIDMKTHEEEEYEGVQWAIRAGNDDKYIYYTDDMYRLMRLSLETGETKKLASDVLDFTVGNGYIYFSSRGINSNYALKIVDIEGNVIKEIESFDNDFESDPAGQLFTINNSLYMVGNDSILIANQDGSDIHFVDIEE